MSSATVQTISAVVFFSFWPVWLVWELFLLWRRAGHGDYVQTLSMRARELGWKANSVVYAWFGLGAHYWWTGSEYAPVWSGVLFWLILAALFARDLWNVGHDTAACRLCKFRNPIIWMVVGLLAGHFLFPQGVLPS